MLFRSGSISLEVILVTITSPSLKSLSRSLSVLTVQTLPLAQPLPTPMPRNNHPRVRKFEVLQIAAEGRAASGRFSTHGKRRNNHPRVRKFEVMQIAAEGQAASGRLGKGRT